jgi:hypothetical protein
VNAVDALRIEHERNKVARPGVPAFAGAYWSENVEAALAKIDELERERELHAQHHTVEWNSPAEADEILRGCSPVAARAKFGAAILRIDELTDELKCAWGAYDALRKGSRQLLAIENGVRGLRRTLDGTERTAALLRVPSAPPADPVRSEETDGQHLSSTDRRSNGA